jgi:hypothetical protein
MKTEKYAIQFVSIDTALSMEIQISKKEFERQYTFLQKQMLNTENDENAVEHYTDTTENNQIIITRHRFSVGMGDTWLSVYKCKSGYHFK